MKLSALSRVDFLLSLLAGVLLQVEVWIFEPRSPAALRSLLCLVAAGALAFMRRYPVGSFVVNGVAIYGLIAVGSPSDLYQWTNLLALVLMASRTSLKRGLIPLGFGLLGVAFYFWRFPHEGGIPTMLIIQSLYLAGFFGGTSQRALLASERIANERDIAEARLAASQAQAELDHERNRIARELHDVVGHALTAMVVQAGASETIFERDPNKAREGLRSIARQGRHALADMDRMLSLLRGETPLTRLPRIEDLEGLIDGLTGPAIALHVTGDLAAVPASVSLSGYRIVQEALTNALRHSGAAHVTVDVVVASDLSITVTDDGRGGAPASGRGLNGMAERAELHGGSFNFGEGEKGGFRIEARLPFGVES